MNIWLSNEYWLTNYFSKINILSTTWLILWYAESTGKINQFPYLEILLPLIHKHVNCETHTILYVHSLNMKYEYLTLCSVSFLFRVRGGCILSIWQKRYGWRQMWQLQWLRVQIVSFLCPWHDNFSFSIYKQTLNWHIGWHVYHYVLYRCIFTWIRGNNMDIISNHSSKHLLFYRINIKLY